MSKESINFAKDLNNLSISFLPFTTFFHIFILIPNRQELNTNAWLIILGILISGPFIYGMSNAIHKYKSWKEFLMLSATFFLLGGATFIVMIDLIKIYK